MDDPRTENVGAQLVGKLLDEIVWHREAQLGATERERMAWMRAATMTDCVRLAYQRRLAAEAEASDV